MQGSYENDGLVVPVKDIDKAITLYDAESLRDILLEFAESKEEYEDLVF